LDYDEAIRRTELFLKGINEDELDAYSGGFAEDSSEGDYGSDQGERSPTKLKYGGEDGEEEKEYLSPDRTGVNSGKRNKL
jgi:hypothetical protein